jgi:hypothetical protein
MFSRNTSKTLSFTVTSDEPIDESLCLDDPCDLSGWLLKKRRKRMQGWAKRWFELSPSGILSYSVKKGGIKRGFLQIMLATVSISIKQHIIHLDSGTTIFHIKALSNADFEKWMQCLRYRRATTGEKIPNTLETEEEDPIIQALMEMENEIKSLKSLLSEAGVLNADYGHSLGLLSPTVSPASVKKRFPFKRAHLSNTSIEDSHLSMPEKINQSLVLITDFREKISMLHSNQQSNIHSLGIPGKYF